MTMTSDTPSQAARAGWKLVPATATDEMLGTLLKRFDNPQSWWQALLAVSPAPPAEALPASRVEESLLADSRVDMAWADGARAAMRALDRYLPDCPVTRKMERRIAWRERSAIAGRKKAAALTSAPAPEDR